MADRFQNPRELREQARHLILTANAIEDGTWGAVIDGPGTPATVAKVVGCSVQGANNRLRRLYDLGILDREHATIAGGGRQFAYSVAITPREDDHG